MLRLLSKDDVREEIREQVCQMVHCPVLRRAQVALMCFACSHFKSCEIPASIGISELELEDVVFDSKFFKKATYSRKIKTGEVKPKPTKKRKVKVTEKSKTKSEKKSTSDSKGGKTMRGAKKEAVLKYLKDNPNATVGEVKKACNVSYVYAGRILQSVRKKNNQNPSIEN